jgi:hypothetical protein
MMPCRRPRSRTTRTGGRTGITKDMPAAGTGDRGRGNVTMARWIVAVIAGWMGTVPITEAAAFTLPDIFKRVYVDATYLARNTNPAGTGEKRFITAGETELLFDYRKLKINLDLHLTNEATAQDNSLLEQAYLEVPVLQGMGVQVGAFSNPLGWEREDAPDRDQISHGQIYNLLDEQTTLSGNTVEGVGFHAGIGHSAFFAGLLNDLGDIANRRSIEVMFTTDPVDNLDMVAGFVTQSKLDDNPSSAETLLDLSAQWRGTRYTVAFEYFAGDKLINAAYGLYGRYRWDRFLVSARWDQVSYLISTVQDTSTYTATAAYLIDDHLKLAVEYQHTTNDNTLPIVLTLPDHGNTIRLQALVIL